MHKMGRPQSFGSSCGPENIKFESSHLHFYYFLQLSLYLYLYWYHCLATGLLIILNTAEPLTTSIIGYSTDPDNAHQYKILSDQIFKTKTPHILSLIIQQVIPRGLQPGIFGYILEKMGDHVTHDLVQNFIPPSNLFQKNVIARGSLVK